MDAIANGSVILKNSITLLIRYKENVGLNVYFSGNLGLSWRFGRNMGGEPSHEASFILASSGRDGVIDRTPIRQPSSTLLPVGSTALLPKKDRFPTFVLRSIIKPLIINGGQMLTESATKLSLPISSKSVEI